MKAKVLCVNDLEIPETVLVDENVRLVFSPQDNPDTKNIILDHLMYTYKKRIEAESCRTNLPALYDCALYAQYLVSVSLEKHSFASLLLLFRKKARSARRLGCKRPRYGSLSLLPFCECTFGEGYLYWPSFPKEANELDAI